jgi:hypothetical protein
MINKVLSWRSSSEGQSEWAAYNLLQEKLQREQAAVSSMLEIIVAAMLFLGGFVFFGFIGVFWDVGMAAGIIGGTVLAILPFVNR